MEKIIVDNSLYPVNKIKHALTLRMFWKIRRAQTGYCK